ncbi:hypothetical protein [Serratia marcescens]|nr:hypothetical protein [Serratia marcescens]
MKKPALRGFICSLLLPDFQALSSIKNSQEGIRRRGAEMLRNRDHKNR